MSYRAVPLEHCPGYSNHWTTTMQFTSFSLANDVAHTRKTRASLSAGCVGMLLMLVHALAWGHATQLSSSQVTVSPHRAQVVLELNGIDVDVALSSAVVGEDGNVSEHGLSAAREALTGYVLEHTRMTVAPDADCRGEVGEIRPKAEHVLVDVEWSCPLVEGALTYRVTLFHEIDPASRHMVTALGEVKMVGLLGVSNPQVGLVNERSNVWRVMWHYLLAGIEHIAIGYDHIAFLLAVIVWGRKLWPLVMVVTAFTIAHSITLSLAVLDVVRLPSQLVETLIALSIVYVAAENFFVRDLRHRGWITFGFGLIHGFGFASVLRDYGLPRDALVPALAAFNVGVEVGQVIIVAAAFALFLLLGRVLGRTKWGPPVLAAIPFVLSGAILLLGLYWTIDRVFGG